MKYQCLIVDDERPALKLLDAYINKLPHLQLIAACESGIEAITALQKHKVDLLFLDIEMPDLSGLELLKTLKNKPQVILTTAYREYAVEGFALDVVDYLVKPFSFERFVQATNKAIEPLQNQTVEDQHFYIRVNHKLEKVIVADICYVESMREYVSIHTKDRRFITHQTMNNMEEKLKLPQFMRVHRSFIISMSRIDAIFGNQVKIGEKTIPVGGSYKKAFFEKLELL